MMSHTRSSPLLACLAILCSGFSPSDAQAGPLIDWLFGGFRTAPAYPVGQPIPVGNAVAAGYGAGYGTTGYGATPMLPGMNAAAGYAGNYGTYYSSQLPAIGPAGAGYSAPMPAGIVAATLPTPTLSYVPNYQTSAQRAPVTYYRPLLTTDPNTGAQVVAMAPCTSYEYMAQRVPAMGRTALFGSGVAPVFQAPPQALPTYTLPSGGVPLTSAAPSITAPYSTAYGTTRSYGSYSTLQPPVGNYPAVPSSVGPAGAYPTAPLGQTPYYGSSNSGSCGGSLSGGAGLQPAPGLVAPQAPGYPYSPAPPTTYAPLDSAQPRMNTPPSYSLPPSSAPPSGIFPPSGGSGVDPADVPPQLPPAGVSAQSSLRPQLRSIVRQPRAGEAPTAGSATNESLDSNSRSLPAMLPIPAPQDFEHQPRWNPGLLREQDMTALRPIDPSQAQLAGQSKAIHWASFESVREIPPAMTKQPAAISNRLRPIQPPMSPGAPTAASVDSQPAPRQTGGWKVSR